MRNPAPTAIASSGRPAFILIKGSAARLSVNDGVAQHTTAENWLKIRPIESSARRARRFGGGEILVI